MCVSAAIVRMEDAERAAYPASSETSAVEQIEDVENRLISVWDSPLRVTGYHVVVC